MTTTRCWTPGGSARTRSGRLVRVELPDQTLEGVAGAIDPDGALVVGDRRVVVGDVVHLNAGSGDPSHV